MKRSNQRNLSYGLGKRRKKATAQDGNNNKRTEDDPISTEAALTFFHAMFNPEKFDGRVPPIIFTHQLYSVVNNKTQVDREVNELKEKKEVKVFCLGSETETCIVFTKDYKDSLRKNDRCPSAITEKFISKVVDGSKDLTFNKSTMTQFGFPEQEITQLVNGGLLTVRALGNWWLAIPGAGVFMKCYRKGREAILRTIRTSRFKEILLQDLEGRKLQAVQPLGMKYHIYDILGAESVTKIQTTSGVLLKYDE